MNRKASTAALRHNLQSRPSSGNAHRATRLAVSKSRGAFSHSLFCEQPIL